MANEDELPAFKVRGQRRSCKVNFDHWIEEQAKGAASTSAEEGQ